MSVHDYKINADVRRFLVSRWVDVSRLQLGTTNGVVYVIGHLDTTMEDPHRRGEEGGPRDSPGERVLRLVQILEKELRRRPDVRDVVFKLDNVYKRGGKWRAMDGGPGGGDTGWREVGSWPARRVASGGRKG